MILRRRRRSVCACGLKAEVVLNPPREALMALARAVKPTARHYHHAAYWRHLYDDNPFRPKGLPWAVALMVDGVAEAMVTAVGVPTTQGPGALLAAWMRMPECHAEVAGALVMQPYLARTDVQLLAYDPSDEAKRFYERAGWRQFDARRWGGKPDRFDAGLNSLDISTIRPRFRQEDDVWAIDRTAEFWRWRFGQHPVKHALYSAAGATAVVVPGRPVLRIEDLVTSGPAPLAGFLSAVAAAEPQASTIVLETDNDDVELAARQIGLRPVRSVPLYWRGAPKDVECYRSLADADFGIQEWW